MTNRDFIGNILKFAVPSIVSSLIAIIVLPLVSRIYPAEEYGYISNFYSFGNLIMSFMLLGLDNAYIRFFNEPPDHSTTQGLFLYTLTVGSVVCIISTIVAGLFFYPYISDYLFGQKNRLSVILLGIYVLFLIFYRLLNINVRFSENYKRYSIQQTLFILGNRLLFVVAGLFNTEYLYSILVMLITTILIDIISFAFERIELSNIRISRSACQKMILFALPVLPATVITFLNNSVAKVVLGGYGFRDEVGILAIATSAANVFLLIPSAFGAYWGPFMFRYYETEKERIRKVHDIVLLSSLLIVTAIFLLQDIIYYILGAEYRGSQSYFMLIMLTPVTTFIGETTNYGLTIKKKTQYILISALTGSILNILLCLTLAPRWRAAGTALAIGISALVTFFIQAVMAQKYYRSINHYFKTMLSIILISGICLINVIAYKNFLFRISLSGIIIILSVIIYFDLIKNITFKIIQYIKRKLVSRDA